MRPQHAAPEPGRRTRVLLAAGVAAPILAWGLSVPAMLTWPAYDPVMDSISLLANAPQGWLQTLAFIVSGGLGFAWAAGMGRVLGATAADRRRVWRLLAFQSVLAITFALFPTDAKERGVTLVGKLHLITFGLYATTMPAALIRISRIMGHDSRWTRWAWPTRLAGASLVASILLVPVTLYGPLLPWLGLLERIYVAIPSAWEAAVSLAGLRMVNRPATAPR